MRIARILATAILLTTVSACGGGGGGNNTGPASTLPLATSLVETCVVPGLDEWLFMIKFATPFWDPAGVPDSRLVIENFLPDSIRISAHEGTQELLSQDACIAFPASGGLLPFNPLPVQAGGLPVVPGLMPGVVDGTVMLHILKHTSVPPDTKVEIGAEWQGGVPVRAATNTSITLGNCVVQLRFSGADPGDIMLAIPDVTMDLTVDDPSGQLVGTLILDGTDIAVVNVTLNGTDDHSFQVELSTGIVTAL